MLCALSTACWCCLQEASDDGWDSLLGNNDLDFVVPAGL
jgi:hypothetical protein